MTRMSLRPHDKEFMRMAMLRHEETFKQQVSELHRLYQVQKTMMTDIDARIPEQWSQEISFRQRKKLHSKQAAESEDKNVSAILAESEIELTLGPSSSIHCERTKHEMLLNSESSHIHRPFNGHEMRDERLRRPPWVFQILSL